MWLIKFNKLRDCVMSPRHFQQTPVKYRKYFISYFLCAKKFYNNILECTMYFKKWRFDFTKKISGKYISSLKISNCDYSFIHRSFVINNQLFFVFLSYVFILLGTCRNEKPGIFCYVC